MFDAAHRRPGPGGCPIVTHPIYERTAWDHGFAPIDRALGAVRVLQHELVFQLYTDPDTSRMPCPPFAGQAPAENESLAMAQQPSLMV